MWGLGHTITLLLVGGAIIAFKIVFNARLGLSLELCVAMMLIVLGILNLFDVRAKTISHFRERDAIHNRVEEAHDDQALGIG